MGESVSFRDLSYIDSLRHLSDGQEKLLAALPIPSALLSILGSTSIIYMVCRRKEHRSTPYTRLLTAMSASDILFSVSLAIGSFLKPSHMSHKAWTFGNEASCKASSFLSQFSRSAILYNGMLSFYFLLVARFGWKSRTIARYVEPILHLVAIGFPLITATVGAVHGFYAEMEFGFDCWASDYHGSGEMGEGCQSYAVGWFFGALPFLLVFLSLIVNNMIIWRFVQRQTRPLNKPEESSNCTEVEVIEQDPETTSPQKDDSLSVAISRDSASVRSTNINVQDESESSNGDESAALRDSQLKRLQLVRSQALLFVGSFFVCNVFWGISVIIQTSAKAREEEKPAKFYFIAILNAIFLPLQGFFNVFVFIRPKYIKTRLEFPRETRFWALRRVMHGDSVRETRPKVAPALRILQNKDKLNIVKDRLAVQPQQQGNAIATESSRHASQKGALKIVPEDDPMNTFAALDAQHLRMSSISASSGDFDEENPDEICDSRWSAPQDLSTWVPIKESRRQKQHA